MWWLLVGSFVGTQGSDTALEPLLSAHCFECHAGEEPKAELDLSRLLTPPSPGGSVLRRETLARVRAVLAAGEMPPLREPRPPAELLEAALGALERELGPEVERPRLRRLNRVEYEHAVRDLFGVGYPARELFPADDVGALFDNDAVAAAASGLHVERWIEAAERVAALALPLESQCETHAWGAAELAVAGGAQAQGASVSIYSAGSVAATHVVPRASRYRLELAGWGDLAGTELPRVALELDGRELAQRVFTHEGPALETLALTLELAQGGHEFGARFLNDHHAPEHPDPGERDRNVHVASLALVGPLDPPPETEFTRRVAEGLAHGSPGEELTETLAALGLRVWRRPLAPEELARLAALTPGDAPPRARVRTALVALLASPNFLYKVERAEASARGRSFELATRLSFFLWASVPDDALLASAARGELVRAEALRAEVRRLLRDARSRALVEEFGAQWLGWRALTRATPDRELFPAADAALLSSMRQESEAFFEAMLREERPLDEFLEARFTFVDERLARLYGLEGVMGEGVRRVPLADDVRGGLLGQAALLTVTSNPTRTSPVKRGKWVLETLLGQRVPPPPPGVGALAEPDDTSAPQSLRARLERHRADPDCASCHAELDPLGFALEGFDAIGRARTHDGEGALDPRGELADGTVLEGVAALRAYLVASGRFPEALARALFVYALGREPSAADARELHSALGGLAAEQRTLAGVIELVCACSAFRGEAREHGASADVKR